MRKLVLGYHVACLVIISQCVTAFIITFFTFIFVNIGYISKTFKETMHRHNQFQKTGNDNYRVWKKRLHPRIIYGKSHLFQL